MRNKSDNVAYEKEYLPVVMVTEMGDLGIGCPQNTMLIVWTPVTLGVYSTRYEPSGWRWIFGFTAFGLPEGSLITTSTGPSPASEMIKHFKIRKLKQSLSWNITTHCYNLL